MPDRSFASAGTSLTSTVRRSAATPKRALRPRGIDHGLGDAGRDQAERGLAVDLHGNRSATSRCAASPAQPAGRRSSRTAFARRRGAQASRYRRPMDRAPRDRRAALQLVSGAIDLAPVPERPPAHAARLGRLHTLEHADRAIVVELSQRRAPPAAALLALGHHLEGVIDEARASSMSPGGSSPRRDRTTSCRWAGSPRRRCVPLRAARETRAREGEKAD